jgi:hypothetical protein
MQRADYSICYLTRSAGNTRNVVPREFHSVWDENIYASLEISRLTNAESETQNKNANWGDPNSKSNLNAPEVL